MAIPKFLEDLLIISKLGDNPGADNGLSSSGLREKFDEAGVKIQKYINDTLIPALSGLSNPEEGLDMKNDIAMGGHRVTGLGEPVENGDAVPLGYANGHFAPAGYGLGGECQYVYSWDEAVNNGYYKSNGNSPDGYWWWGHVAPYDVNNGVQVAFREVNGVLVESHRLISDGVPKEWEWENPPMEPNKEYRTTERWGGKPVYRKLVTSSLDAIDASNGTKDVSIAHGISNFGKVLSCHLTKGETYLFPYPSDAPGNTAVIRVDDANIMIRAVYDTWGADTWYFDLRYTKTT